MAEAIDYRQEFEALRDLLLELAPERSVERLLRKVVQELAERPQAAVSQVWLIEKAEGCSSCPMRPRCPDRTRCLHLAAGAESCLAQSDLQARPIEREMVRIPLGLGVVGQIGASGGPITSVDPLNDLQEFVEHDWMIRRGIQGFDGQPIRFQNEVMGVLAQFNHVPTLEQNASWLRILADHIGAAISNARAFEENERLKAQLELENSFLQEEVREANSYGDMIGQSGVFKELQRQIEMVARTDATVLILGESGTGKELVAREIHKCGLRSRRPVIRVSCASIPRELYESEFFGHVKGAFTGALKDRAGRFEAAQGGTLFLDEVGEIPLELQSKFLRVLQEGQYERVGEERTRTVDVRIIAATNRDLLKEVDAGRFRQDLFYRLNVFPIELAPLRKRKDDIPLLAAHFLERAACKLKLPPGRLTQANLAQLQAYDWPGNIRELQNRIERALILAQNGSLWFDLPMGQEEISSAPQPRAASDANQPEVLSDFEFRQRERDNFLAALNKSRWKIHGPGGTAELLGLKPTTLISRIKRMGLRKPV